MDEAGWIGRYSATNPTVAPAGEELIQAQMPIRPGESVDRAAHSPRAVLEGPRGLARPASPGVVGRCWTPAGALDMPGTSWRDRPAVDRGDGVFLAGDMVAAPGLLGRGLVGECDRGQPARA